MSTPAQSLSATAVPPSSPAPMERIALIDTLRGIALGGVILMNVVAMVMAFEAQKVMAHASPADMTLGTLDLVLVAGKARCSFAFLFGLGFGVMMLRADARGEGFTGMYLRRMGGLLLFGLLNQCFFYFGDILVTYAVLGAVMLLFRRCSDRTLLWLAGLLVIGGPVLHGVLMLVFGTLPNAAGIANGDAARYERAVSVYHAAAYTWQTVHTNATFTLTAWREDTAMMFFYTTGVLGLFMLGLVVARRGILFDVAAHRPVLKRVAWIGLPVGLAGSALFATVNFGWRPAPPMDAIVRMSYLGLPVMAMGYIALLSLLLARRGRRVEAVLAPMGRMALTNYLSANVIGTYIWNGYGLDLMGKLSMVQMNLVALAIFLFLLAASHAWLRVANYGPAEWLWRGITRLGLPPLWKQPRVAT